MTLQRGGGPLAVHGCECPWEQLGLGSWRTYHAEDCPWVTKIRTACPKTRELADAVLAGLTIMRDDEGDEWQLPDLVAINHSVRALHALVQHAEDRHRFKTALARIGKEWTDASGTPDDIREYARNVVAGGSARASFRPVGRGLTEGPSA